MRVLRAGLALWVLLLASCITRAQVRNAPAEAGVERVYPGPFDSLQSAVKDILTESGYGIREEGWMDRGRWRVLATQGLTTGGLGRIARVVVEDHPTDARVWVLVQQKLETAEGRAASASMAADLHGRLGKQLGVPNPGPSAPLVTSEVERTCEAPLRRCSEATRQVCRAAGYEISTEDASGEELRTLSAEGTDGRRLFVALYALAEGRTRAVIEVRGGPDAENQAAAEEFRAALEKELTLPAAR